MSWTQNSSGEWVNGDYAQKVVSSVSTTKVESALASHLLKCSSQGCSTSFTTKYKFKGKVSAVKCRKCQDESSLATATTGCSDTDTIFTYSCVTCKKKFSTGSEFKGNVLKAKCGTCRQTTQVQIQSKQPELSIQCSQFKYSCVVCHNAFETKYQFKGNVSKVKCFKCRQLQFDSEKYLLKSI